MLARPLPSQTQPAMGHPRMLSSPVRLLSYRTEQSPGSGTVIVVRSGNTSPYPPQPPPPLAGPASPLLPGPNANTSSGPVHSSSGSGAVSTLPVQSCPERSEPAARSPLPSSVAPPQPQSSPSSDGSLQLIGSCQLGSTPEEDHPAAGPDPQSLSLSLQQQQQQQQSQNLNLNQSNNQQLLLLSAQSIPMVECRPGATSTVANSGMKMISLDPYSQLEARPDGSRPGDQTVAIQRSCTEVSNLLEELQRTGLF
mmetsp:Transcript_70533/g.147703  ORF Transcript_70533/g.147703 Transcript_70533/m.147703 type:complete len:253 (+) Transcript_70533:2099-2857(+)